MPSSERACISHDATIASGVFVAIMLAVSCAAQKPERPRNGGGAASANGAGASAPTPQDQVVASKDDGTTSDARVSTPNGARPASSAKAQRDGREPTNVSPVRDLGM